MKQAAVQRHLLAPIAAAAGAAAAAAAAAVAAAAGAAGTAAAAAAAAAAAGGSVRLALCLLLPGWQFVCAGGKAGGKRWVKRRANPTAFNHQILSASTTQLAICMRD